MTKENIIMPLFERSFRQRVYEAWERFAKGEVELRQLIQQKAESEVIMEKLDEFLSVAFEKVYAEVGFNGEKYDLILNLEGDWSRLFSSTYFQRQAPKEVLEHWNILVGRQSREKDLSDYRIYIWGDTVWAKDIQVWMTWTDEVVKASVYCKELLPLLEEREGEAYWIGYIMLDHAIGELAEMKYIDELEIIKAPMEETPLSLKQLLPYFIDKLSLSKEELFNPERYCQLYSAYRMEPNENAEDGLRRDVFAGSSCFVPLLNDFWNGSSRIMDSWHKDGIVAGYFCYPLYGFEGENRGEQILDFRDNIVASLEAVAGLESFTFIGGATGIYYGYIDFIAWDLDAVIDAAITAFGSTDIDWAVFHSFRQDVDGITIYEKE